MTAVPHRPAIVRSEGAPGRFTSVVPLSHGQAARGGTRTYHAWKAMLRRCTNPLVRTGCDMAAAASAFALVG